ncbi:MAG: NrfD/PsrC family molybdoenzyme membrane anchor subunit, partial [Planctomycetota bacterium]
LAALWLGVGAVIHTVCTGVGTWGLNRSVGWGWAIANFVFWIGIGHAGTLISAVLLLMRQRWRTAVNRSAEAMTIFAVLCAAVFPVIHLGRPWLAYWTAPYPNTRGPLWVNFRSPLTWDMFAVATYLVVSVVFWYVGMLPDLATARDRAKPGWRRSLYSLLSFGWIGSGRTWARYGVLYLLLAGLATPLVVSVHTVVSFDFATSLIPGWHTTIFPPYFVCGAIFSGMALVMVLVVLVRRAMNLRRYITPDHLDAMAKITLAGSLLVTLAYATELFLGWYSGDPHERFVSLNRMAGPYRWFFAVMIVCNVVLPQVFWGRKGRRSPGWILVVGVAVTAGMWIERFLIVVSSLHRDFLPSSWADYAPTFTEVGLLVGSFGLFFTMFFLFCRFLPVVSIAESKRGIGKGDTETGGMRR